MPLYHYFCPTCEEDKRRLLSVEAASKDVECSKCKSKMSRKVQGPSSQAVETLDNGTMSKRLERLVDAERLYTERCKVNLKDS